MQDDLTGSILRVGDDAVLRLPVAEGGIVSIGVQK